MPRLRLITNEFKKHLDLLPVLLFALIPALTFWNGSASNLQELTFGLMSRTLIASILVSIFFYGVFYFIVSKDSFKASILALISVLITFSYSEMYIHYSSLSEFFYGKKHFNTSKDGFLWFVFILIVLLCFFLRRVVKSNKLIKDYLALLAIILAAFNTYPIVKFWLENRDLNNLSFGSTVETEAQLSDSEKPDIYYLIFDRYAGESTLRSVYDYSNEPFLSYLNEAGFYVANKSAANYPATTLSLSSSLNLDYLPNEFQNNVDTGVYTSLLHDKIESNQVVPFLKKQGYSFTNIGPWWSATKYNQYADHNIINPEGVIVLNRKVDLQEHEHLLFQRTLFYRLSRKDIKVGNSTLYGRTYPDNDSSGRAVHKQTMLHQFRELKRTVDTHSNVPKYVFAHFLMPHNPYVVNEKCEHMKKNLDHEYTNYVRQLKCTNSQIKQAVKKILKDSKRDPIIIIQADEGPYPIEYVQNKDLEWSKVPDKLLHQKSKIINAYYFPKKNYGPLYQTISPVNSFRVLFNQYFGADYALLEDKHFFSETREKRFQLIDLSAKFK